MPRNATIAWSQVQDLKRRGIALERKSNGDERMLMWIGLVNVSYL